METYRHVSVEGSENRIYVPDEQAIGIGDIIVYATPHSSGIHRYFIGRVEEIIFRQVHSSFEVVKNITEDIERFEDERF